jgi:hypothetical protein
LIKLLNKIIKYCEEKGLEFKKNQGRGINIYVLWQHDESRKKLGRYLKKIKANYKVESDSNYDYAIYIIK